MTHKLLSNGIIAASIAGLITIIAALIAGLITVFPPETINLLSKKDKNFDIYYNQLIDQKHIVSCDNDNVIINKVVGKETVDYMKGECVYVIFLISGFEIKESNAVDIRLDAVLKDSNNKIVANGRGILSITDPKDWLYAESIDPVRNSLINKYNIPKDGSVILKVRGFVFEENLFKNEFYDLVITATDLFTGNSDSFKITIYLKK